MLLLKTLVVGTSLRLIVGNPTPQAVDQTEDSTELICPVIKNPPKVKIESNDCKTALSRFQVDKGDVTWPQAGDTHQGTTCQVTIKGNKPGLVRLPLQRVKDLVDGLVGQCEGKPATAREHLKDEKIVTISLEVVQGK